MPKRLQELQWYDRVETYTHPGTAFMTVWLKDKIPPDQVPEQFYQARKKLADEQARLPKGVMGPFINDEYGDVSFALYAASILDSACGCAVHAHLELGQSYTTLELKVSYVRGLSTSSGRIRAEGRTVSVGRRVAFAEAVLTDEAGRICATATSTLMIFGSS